MIISKNELMDKILKENMKTPFSKKFGRVKFLEPAGKQAPQPPSAAEEGVILPVDVTPNVSTPLGIDFNEESYSSAEKEEDEFASECKYEQEESNHDSVEKFATRKNFQCPVKSCKKVYTSSYGLKYHMDHGHTEAKTTEKRPYVCHVGNCGKTYKNNNGLKYHIAHAHKGAVYNESEYMF